MRLEATSDLWWKNAVVYCVDVEVFADGNGDGVGDFVGLTEHVDYLAGLGVTCIWLLPFYPSPRRDSGYDVTDYYGVDPRFGTLGDFVEFVRTATDRGIRVIADLVVNHTSDEHPWFQSARRDRGSPYRDYYVWLDEKPPGDESASIVFPDAEDSIWQWDDEAAQFYLHHFYRFQPDLNVANPEVLRELRKVMGFWLELGLSGFRLDAVPYFLSSDGPSHVVDPHAHLRRMREFGGRRRGDVMLLGEVNVEPRELGAYFGGHDGDELHMLFNFPVMEATWLSLTRGNASPLVHALRQLPAVAQPNQFGNFVRNHDELTLDKLTLAERTEVFDRFAPEESMRLYGRGIRRRAPTMLEGDRRQLELLYSLALSLPGTPVVLYGEEIGLGDDQAQPGRMAVRVPMQWNAERNAGFSYADADRLVRPVVAQGPFGYQHVNVSAQRHDPHSFLNWFERMVRWRRECAEIGWGAWSVVETEAPCVFAHRCDWQESTVVAVHNFAAEEVRITLPVGLGDDVRQELAAADRDYGPLGPADPSVTLSPYGYLWLRLRRPPDNLPAAPAEQV